MAAIQFPSPSIALKYLFTRKPFLTPVKSNIAMITLLMIITTIMIMIIIIIIMNSNNNNDNNNNNSNDVADLRNHMSKVRPI